jgi:hypothetical protein
MARRTARPARGAAWRAYLPAPGYGTATGGVSVVHPWVHCDELDKFVRRAAVGTPCRRASLRARTRVNDVLCAATLVAVPQFTPISLFRNF